MSLFVSIVFNIKTRKIINRFCGNDKQEVEILARKALYYGNSIIKDRCYKIFEKRAWHIRKLKNCSYKGKSYETIYLQLFTDWDGLIKINVTCNGANMNNYDSVKEAFSYINIKKEKNNDI